MIIKNLIEIMQEGGDLPSKEWQLRMIQSEQCLSYIAWNERTKEALLVDPKDTDCDAYFQIAETLKGYRWIGVVDTHTHADHISAAAHMAQKLSAPLIMHVLALTQRVDIRISKSTHWETQAGALLFLLTPGHTPDSMTVSWGPYLFGGDTLLYGDTGRDDLPGGSPEAHYESMQLIKSAARAEMILLPGHDHKGGRASTWSKQLEVNASLTQGRDEFVREAAAFEAPAPKLLKQSLKENFK